MRGSVCGWVDGAVCVSRGGRGNPGMGEVGQGVLAEVFDGKMPWGLSYELEESQWWWCSEKKSATEGVGVWGSWTPLRRGQPLCGGVGGTRLNSRLFSCPYGRI